MQSSVAYLEHPWDNIADHNAICVLSKLANLANSEKFNIEMQDAFMFCQLCQLLCNNNSSNIVILWKSLQRNEYQIYFLSLPMQISKVF